MADLPASDDFAPSNLISNTPGRGAEVRAHWDTDGDDGDDLSFFDDLLERAETHADDAPAAPAAPPEKDFVHLHVHSEYSLLDGLSSVYDIVKQVKGAGMRSVALTDHGNLSGAIDFYDAAKKAGVKPILGVEAYVSPRGMQDKNTQDRGYYHLILLAKNLQGYQNLMQLVTKGHLDGYYYKPRIDRELLAQHAGGLIALSGCYSGEPSRAILDGDPKKALEAAAWYRDVFKEDYFLELQDHGNADDQIVNKGLLEINRQLGIPYLATNDTHYAKAEQGAAQDMLLCVQTNSTIDDPKRMRMDPHAFYLKTPQEMWSLFGEIPQALTNTVAVAERIDLNLEFGRLNFPALDHIIPNGEDPQAFLTRTTRRMLEERYGDRLTQVHRDRLEYELQVIAMTGFPSYILFVWDFVSWARKQGITCGPRGSAAGSIVLYALGISDVDPVGYGLTFERFLNPERIQMPDIDMDFADDRREEVIQYVVDRYGRERVAQIITFGRLLARAAIRDVGRAMAYPLSEVDRVAKLIPSIPIGLKLDQAVEQNPELKQLYANDPSVKKLIDAAKSVEGVARHAGTHAAGVVVADQPLVNYVPLQKPSKGEGQMTQYTMKALEKIGLLKMDFLGLANLTMLAKAIVNVKQVRGIDIDLPNLPDGDPATYEMLSRGETKTVFQLEGSGMTRYVQDLKPSDVNHLAAMVALYRPGPMAHIPAYIARREGREAATAPDPSLEEVLKESYGIIVYQDQVLQVVQKVAGYSLGRADVLRRVMGKKDKVEMEAEGPRFIQATVDSGYSRQTADHLWELLQPFAGYAFNKAHAYCYAFLAYQTAYLKANYPVEWFAAVLTTIGQDTDKVVGVVGECRRMGVEILKPDVNRSGVDSLVELLDEEARARSISGATHGIRYGLAAVKNVGEGAVEHIVAERDANGPFKAIDDFCRRLNLQTANKRVIESLIKAGALDTLPGTREAKLKGLDSAMGAAQIDQKAASSGQSSLFDVFGDNPAEESAPMVAAFSLPFTAAVPQREKTAWEKEVLGFTFQDHPYQEAYAWLRQKLTHDTSMLTPEISGEKVKFAGIVAGVRRLTTKTKGQMAVLTVEDLHGSAEVVVFPRIYEKSPDLWFESKILVLEGKVDSRDDRAQIVLDKAEEWLPPAEGTVPPPLPVVVVPEHVPVAVARTAPSAHPARPVVHPPRVEHAEPAPTPAPPGTVAPPTTRLRAIIRRTADDNSTFRAIEQIGVLVNDNPGNDLMELVIQARDGSLILLSGAHINVRITAELQSQIRSLVGEENLVMAEVAPAPAF